MFCAAFQAYPKTFLTCACYFKSCSSHPSSNLSLNIDEKTCPCCPTSIFSKRNTSLLFGASPVRKLPTVILSRTKQLVGSPNPTPCNEHTEKHQLCVNTVHVKILWLIFSPICKTFVKLEIFPKSMEFPGSPNRWNIAKWVIIYTLPPIRGSRNN